MRVTPRNILRHELIGLKVRVLSYPDPALVGTEGTVADETQKTFLIRTQYGRLIRVLKENGVFEFQLPTGEKVILRGDLVVGRPAERLKKLRGWA